MKRYNYPCDAGTYEQFGMEESRTGEYIKVKDLVEGKTQVRVDNERIAIIETVYFYKTNIAEDEDYGS